MLRRSPFHGHRFPPEVIRHAVWLYLRFTLSFRDIEDLLAERGLDVSYETIRRWVLKFGPLFARELRRRRPRPSSTWHLDEMVVRIGGKRLWLASGRQRGRGPRHPHAAASQHERGLATDEEAAPQAGLRACRHGDRQARCSRSNHLDQHSDSCPAMPPSTTPSTF